MPAKLIVSPFDPELMARKQVTMSVPFLPAVGNTYTADLDAWLSGRSITRMATEQGKPLGVVVQSILLELHPHLHKVWPQAEWSPRQRAAFIKRRDGYNV